MKITSKTKIKCSYNEYDMAFHFANKLSLNVADDESLKIVYSFLARNDYRNCNFYSFDNYNDLKNIINENDIELSVNFEEYDVYIGIEFILVKHKFNKYYTLLNAENLNYKW